VSCSSRSGAPKESGSITSMAHNSVQIPRDWMYMPSIHVLNNRSQLHPPGTHQELLRYTRLLSPSLPRIGTWGCQSVRLFVVFFSALNRVIMGISFWSARFSLDDVLHTGIRGNVRTLDEWWNLAHHSTCPSSQLSSGVFKGDSSPRWY
jgi:hypothetical protein